MDFSYILEYEGISIYEASKRSGIPYSTLSDIVRGRTPIERVSSGNLHALAKVLDMSMDDLYYQMFVPHRPDFELFKSSMCHNLKELGDLGFLKEVLETNTIRKLFNRKWHPECLYLLAMTDYVCKENNIDICSDYDDIREIQLKEIIYPASVIAVCMASNSERAKKEALKEAIPEFLKYNIVESEIRNVI